MPLPPARRNVRPQRDAWLVEADLPGVRRDDGSVELHDGQLAIHDELTEKERVGPKPARSKPQRSQIKG